LSDSRGCSAFALRRSEIGKEPVLIKGKSAREESRLGFEGEGPDEKGRSKGKEGDRSIQ
jgi:hypothetical protein